MILREILRYVYTGSKSLVPEKADSPGADKGWSISMFFFLFF